MKVLRQILLLTLLLSLLCCFLFSCKGCGHSKKINLYAEPKSGEVVKIFDGDTYEILTPNKENIRIRMAGIDAPEKGQPFYRRAKEFLGQLCFRKNVIIEKVTIDQYGRIVAWTYFDDGISLSHEMVKNGFAWHFLKYDNSPELDSLEKRAREQHLGLWADPDPTAPWDIRAHRRSGKKDSEE